MADGMSKKELKEMRKIEEMRRSNLEKKASMIKWVSIGVIATVFVGFFLFLVVSLKNNNPNLSQNGDRGNVRSFSDSGEFRVKEGSVAPIDARRVTIVEFADLQCPACQQYQPITKNLLDLYPENVVLNFKHFPLTQIHRNSMPAAVAAEAAGKQDKFFEMVDLLYARQAEWSDLPDTTEKFKEYAKELELDLEKFSLDLESQELKDKIDAQRDEGVEAGVNGTPSFFINGVYFPNPSDVSGFQTEIDKILAESKSQDSAEVSATPSADSSKQGSGQAGQAEENSEPEIDL